MLWQKNKELVKLIAKFNYYQYGNLGCQVITGTEEEQKQAYFVSIFLDIYENSFNGF